MCILTGLGWTPVCHGRGLSFLLSIVHIPLPYWTYFIGAGCSAGEERSDEVGVILSVDLPIILKLDNLFILLVTCSYQGIVLIVSATLFSSIPSCGS